MLAEEEAQRIEKERREEENRLDKLKKEEEAITESKKRVYEHFKEVSKTVVEGNVTESPRKPQITLSQMPERKRKRDSNINKHHEIQEEKAKCNLSTPIPMLETRILQGAKQSLNETEHLRQEQEIVSKNQGEVSNNKSVNSLR